jgi:hypothetical protein
MHPKEPQYSITASRGAGDRLAQALEAIEEQ